MTNAPHPPILAPIALAALLLFPLPALSATAAERNAINVDQAAEGWISLFDGETLFGWRATSNANWDVQEGAITVSEGEQGFLMTTGQFADYELHVEYRTPAGNTNSGVFLHTPLNPMDPAKDCYELNIAPPDNPFPNGSLVARLKWTGDPGENAIEWDAFPPPDRTDLEGAYGTPVAPEDNGWIPIDVWVEGAKVSVAVFGIGLYTYADSQPLRRGHIGLQFREGPISFRNVRLRPLNLQPMLNGKDLTGWNTDERRASEFKVTRGGELQVTGGSGQLESDASYGDFTFQFECRVDGDGLNSGIFFRCIPRQYMQGYECQISNKMTGGDPAKPSDFGTGAIYRRIPARRIVAKDHEWFTTTVNAVGSHIAVWVDGYQVTDWTDPRPADENPRAGLRTASGTLAIQGHDPTTNLRFRNLRIAELPAKTE